MVGNSDLIERITACAAVEQHPNPDAAARPYMWKFVTSPGWAEKFAASSSEAPGSDEDAVTDAMILEAFKRIVPQVDLGATAQQVSAAG